VLRADGQVFNRLTMAHESQHRQEATARGNPSCPDPRHVPTPQIFETFTVVHVYQPGPPMHVRRAPTPLETGG